VTYYLIKILTRGVVNHFQAARQGRILQLAINLLSISRG
jgi:hypothetical protein